MFFLVLDNIFQLYNLQFVNLTHHGIMEDSIDILLIIERALG